MALRIGLAQVGTGAIALRLWFLPPRARYACNGLALVPACATASPPKSDPVIHVEPLAGFAPRLSTFEAG